MSDDALSRQFEMAVAGLYEDERLRSNLTDEEAAPLLRWGEAQLEAARIASRSAAAPDREAAFDAAVQRVRAAIRDIGDLAAERQRLSKQEMRSRVTELQSALRGGTRASSPAIDELASQAASMSTRAFIERLIALAGPPFRQDPGDRSGGGSGREGGIWSPTLGVVLAVVAIAFVLGLAAIVGRGLLSPSSAGPSAGPTPAQHGWYQVFFTSPVYPDDGTKQQKDRLDTKLAAFIDEAAVSVDMAIYQLDLENVTKALLDAQKRGATVRVVTDVDILDDPKENPSFKQLQKAGITVVAGNPNAIMHDKFVVVDDKAVWTGSWNFTVNDTYRYNNNSVLVRSPRPRPQLHRDLRQNVERQEVRGAAPVRWDHSTSEHREHFGGELLLPGG